MKITESTVNQILRSEDIESLFQHDAPSDEYSHEARGIVSAVALLGQNDINEEHLIDIVRAIWTRSFGPFLEEELDMRTTAFRRVAHRILIQDVEIP
jgi:hypothetical protein